MRLVLKNLATHRRSNLLSRSRGISMTKCSGFVAVPSLAPRRGCSAWGEGTEAASSKARAVHARGSHSSTVPESDQRFPWGTSVLMAIVPTANQLGDPDANQGSNPQWPWPCPTTFATVVATNAAIKLRSDISYHCCFLNQNAARHGGSHSAPRARSSRRASRNRRAARPGADR
jgi:hypothetical protein